MPVPRTWASDLTARERRELSDLLLQSPGLLPFTVAAGIMGIDGAVDACRDPSLIATDVVDKLRAAGYRDVTAALPYHQDILAILMGIRLRVSMDKQGRHGAARPLQVTAREFGMTLPEAQDTLRILYAHAPAPAYEAMGV